jgi:hypothetical protein
MMICQLYDSNSPNSTLIGVEYMITADAYKNIPDRENQMWTFTNNGESSGLAQIFKGSSPFDDGGKLEVLEGHPEGANIPFMPDAPQEFASGLDKI